MNNSNHGPGFMNGFLLGAIIGGAAVFLLGTKKGKNILKLISEESFELSELFGGKDSGEEEIVESQHKKCEHCQKKQPVEYETKTEESENSAQSNGGAVSKIAGHGRRFFRVPKKS